MSPHPVDVLLRDLAASGRDVTPGELERILEHLGTASFGKRQQRAPAEVREIVGPHADSLSIYWAKSVFVTQQWAASSREEYLQDLRNAARHPAARLAAYSPPRGPVAGVLTPNAIPADRLGRGALPFVWVVYGAEYGTIVSGYQVSRLAEVTLGSVVTWLK